jgi:hypothetical protein
MHFLTQKPPERLTTLQALHAMHTRMGHLTCRLTQDHLSVIKMCNLQKVYTGQWYPSAVVNVPHGMVITSEMANILLQLPYASYRQLQ